MTTGALLSVNDLAVTFPTDDGDIQAVRGVSFDVAEGETVGIIGESGSGKLVATQALLQLVRGADITGSARFGGAELLTMPAREIRRIRGRVSRWCSRTRCPACTPSSPSVVKSRRRSGPRTGAPRGGRAASGGAAR